MKKGFSLLELVFAIVVISVIVTVAIPKFMGTKTEASVTAIKRDIVSTISAMQSYYLVHDSIDKISDAISIDESKWSLDEDEKSMVYEELGSACITITLESNKITLDVSSDNEGPICTKIRNDKILQSEDFRLN